MDLPKLSNPRCSVISLYSEIHEEGDDLISFILETKDDPRTKRLGSYSKAEAMLLISTSQLANRNHNGVPLTGLLGIRAG